VSLWTSADGELADWMNTTPKVVLSTDADYDVSAWGNSTLAAGDGADQISRLKAGSGGAVVAFGGVRTIRSLVAADLVDDGCARASRSGHAAQLVRRYIAFMCGR
jgi:dihydrofolate reductase